MRSFALAEALAVTDRSELSDRPPEAADLSYQRHRGDCTKRGLLLLAVALAAAALALPAGSATTVTSGHSTLTIRCGAGVAAPTDWYFPTVPPPGLVLLVHGYLSSKSDVAAVAQTIAARTGALVVAPTVSSTQSDPCWIDGTPLHQAFAQLLAGDRAALTASARAAGWTQPLPVPVVLAGHSSGGNLSADAARYLIGTPGFANLRAVVMLDGAAQDAAMTQMRSALPELSGPNFRPVLQIGSPADPTNPCVPDRRGSRALTDLRPGTFVGVELVGGNHLDAIGYVNVLGNLLCGWPRYENVQAVATIASDWVGNALTGSHNGITGGMAGQALPIGAATAVVLPA